jgi:hypothetical protein
LASVDTESERTRHLSSQFRAEDWLVAAFVALVCPILVLVEGAAGPFDTGQPLQGLLRVVGAIAAVACLVTRSVDRPEEDDHPVLSQATAGPVIGAVALVAASGLANLGLPPELAFPPALIVLVVVSPLYGHLPAVPTATRRRLAAPFLLASSGIFWSLVDPVRRRTGVADLASMAPEVLALALGVFVLASAIYYAMLVYGPRQIVEREGTPLAWLSRYGLFVASTVLGIGWLSVLGG